jgi:hypothetical protein
MNKSSVLLQLKSILLYQLNAQYLTILSIHTYTYFGLLTAILRGSQYLYTKQLHLCVNEVIQYQSAINLKKPSKCITILTTF